MPLLLHIYIYCAFGSFLFMVFMTTTIEKMIKKDPDDLYLVTAYNLWNNAPMYFHFLAIFVPVINAIFLAILIIFLFNQVRFWISGIWNDLAYWTIKRFMANRKHQRLKERIIRLLFNKRYLDLYHLHIISEERLWTNIINILKNYLDDEKSKCKPECDPDLHTEPGDQQTPSEGQET